MAVGTVRKLGKVPQLTEVRTIATGLVALLDRTAVPFHLPLAYRRPYRRTTGKKPIGNSGGAPLRCPVRPFDRSPLISLCVLEKPFLKLTGPAQGEMSADEGSNVPIEKALTRTQRMKPGKATNPKVE